MITRELKLSTSGVVQFKLPTDIYSEIMNEYIGTEPNDNLTDTMVPNLAGHLRSEFSLQNIKPKLWEKFSIFLESLVYEYEDTYGFDTKATRKVIPEYTGVSADILDGDNFKPSFQQKIKEMTPDGTEWAIQLDSLWVNYQKRYEFNPPHTHSGDYSFVVFMKIPYDTDEFSHFSDLNSCFNDQTGVNSCFNINRIDPYLKNTTDHSIRISKKHEGVGLIFPSETTHSVYPFYTSEDYRITISGNISAVQVPFGMREESHKPPSFRNYG